MQKQISHSKNELKPCFSLTLLGLHTRKKSIIYYNKNFARVNEHMYIEKKIKIAYNENSEFLKNKTEISVFANELIDMGSSETFLQADTALWRKVWLYETRITNQGLLKDQRYI